MVNPYFSRTFAALTQRDYRLFLFGQIVSVSGTWMQKLAQAWLVLVLTDSGVVLGIVVALQMLPMLLLSTIAGGLADRFEKRRILIWTQASSAIPAAVIGTLVQLDQVAIWMVMAAALVQGVADALDKPARMTLVNDIARPQYVANAVALNSVVQESGKLVGPAIGGIVLGTAGIAAAFFINAASYVPVVVALLMMRTRADRSQVDAGGRRAGLRDTLRYVAARPPLAAALGLMAVTGLMAYNWTVLVPLLVRNTFGGDATVVGWAFSCFGLGGVVGGLALAPLVIASSRRQLVMAGVFSAVLVAFLLAPNIQVAFVLLFATGAASVTFRSTSATLVQLSADPQMRGRVIGLYVLAMNGTTPFGGPLQGWICEAFGSRVGFAAGGATTCLAAFAAYRHLTKRNAWPKRLRSAPVGVGVTPGATDPVGDPS